MFNGCIIKTDNPEEWKIDRLLIKQIKENGENSRVISENVFDCMNLRTYIKIDDEEKIGGLTPGKCF